MFFLFGGLAAVSAISIVFVKNVIHAALLLVVTLLSLAGIFVVFHSEFLAVVQIMVYAGGIIILLAFGIMLTNRGKDGRPLSKVHLVFPGALIAVFFLIFLSGILGGVETKETLVEESSSAVSAVGISFMTEYLLSFELIAFLLLAVLVGAAFLAKKQTELD